MIKGKQLILRCFFIICVSPHLLQSTIIKEPFVHIINSNKHILSGFITTNQLMLRREVFSVSYKIYMKHINTICWHNVKVLDVESGGT